MIDPSTALAALLAIAFYSSTTDEVAKARRASGVEAPATTGDVRLERAVRVQMNTLEWLPIYLVGLVLFAQFVSAPFAGFLGLVWLTGRVLYRQAYMADPAKRGPGFLIQTAACAVLILGALVGAAARLFPLGV